MRWGAGNVTRLRLHSYSSVNRTFLSFNSTYLHRQIRQPFHMRIHKLVDVTASQQPNHGSNVQARYLDPEYRLVRCVLRSAPKLTKHGCMKCVHPGGLNVTYTLTSCEHSPKLVKIIEALPPQLICRPSPTYYSRLVCLPCGVDKLLQPTSRKQALDLSSDGQASSTEERHLKHIGRVNHTFNS